ncbi:response regulator [Almyronema epifaneia]|uniref:Response regulator n=1 Tax=Almyronema epifaneia S1 TaxID=2991925 RepID=A0ABW6I9R5_9CYAN
MIRHQVLLVDDCLEDRVTYRRFLEKDSNLHYQIREATCAETALEQCDQQFPDTIVLDYLLPDADGLEFLAELKQQFPERSPSVILLTGQGNEAVALQARQLGVQAFLVKGELTAPLFREAVHHALSLSVNKAAETLSQTG